jgi:hypothetical protein
MDLTLKRNMSKPNGIFGELFQIDGPFLLKSLEHAYLSPGGLWLPKIPEGQFTCMRGEHELSNGVPFETFEIMGVSGHTGLLFHSGNWEKDSSGCVLLGINIVGSPGYEMITQSRKAFERFMEAQEGVDDFQLTVIS